MQNTYKTSLAVKLELTLEFDLTGATSVSYLIQKPDGTTDTWTATVDTAATGVTSYLTEDGDLDVLGVYVIQPKVVFTGKEYYGDPVSFQISEKITV